MKYFYVYILKCADNTFYTGLTSDIDRRFHEHLDGKYKESYTYNRRPLSLEFFAEFTTVQQAITVEKQIKSWSQKKKAALINGDYESLPNLAKKKFKP
jgi:putative endonuclease